MTMTAAKAALCFALALACFGAAFMVAYNAGHDKAEAEGKAALSALRAEYQEEKRRAADAYGRAAAEALAKYRKEVARGDDLTGQILAADKAHSAETDELKRKIGHATKNGSCTLGPDLVRMLNDASGARVPDPALPGTLCPADPADGAGAGAAPASGLLGRGGAVSQADYLAWTLDYIARARRMEERLDGWRKLFTRPAGSVAEK